MKNILLLLMTVSIIGCIIFFACKKTPPIDKPPVAKAGKDLLVDLPVDSVTLVGNSSKDPDGTISSFLWTKISGPASFTITNPSAPNTTVKNLIQGVFHFELTVTDNEGLSARDTVFITVQPVNHGPVANAGA